MDKFVDAAKTTAKSYVPDKLVRSLRARFRRQPVEEPTSTAIPAQKSRQNIEPLGVNIDWLMNRVEEIRDPALRSYFWILPETGRPSLCAPADSYPALIDAVISIGSRSSLETVYMADRQRVTAPDDKQLSKDLASKPVAQVRLIASDGEFAFFVERWRTDERALIAPKPNGITKSIQLESPSAEAFLETPGKRLEQLYPTPLIEDCDFDVDAVYTWVDSQDPDWQDLFAKFSDDRSPRDAKDDLEARDRLADRFLSRDELRYSLRSLLQFAPWIRQVHIVSNCKPPEWFDESNQRVRWIRHEEILDSAVLPTFNSHAIETAIHRIPGLSEHFLYFNDDLFVMRPVKKSDFFVPNGLAKIRPERYGVIHGEVDSRDPDYINAARNGQALLQSAFGKTATKPHTHSPQSMRQSVAKASEERFAAAFEITRRSRFRSTTDIAPVSFLYPNFAFLTGHAVMDFPKTALMNSNHPYRASLGSYSTMLASRDFSGLPLTLCINDGGGSTQNLDWGAAIVDFMRSGFPLASEAEKKSRTAD